MKTTIDIADPVLREARKVAAREGTTLRALVEDGLRRILTERKRQPKFRLRLVSFKGSGLHPDVRNLSWGEIRDLSYRRGRE